MALVNAIVKAMERIAPLRLAEKWDNASQHVCPESPIRRPDAKSVLLTVDLTPAVVSEALSNAESTSVIVSYHPPIFKPLSAFTLANPLQKSLLLCAAAGVSVYSPHTALDTVHGGINDWLASGLVNAHVKGEVEPLNSPIIGPDGELEGGTGRLVKLENGMKMETLVELVKKHTNLPRVQVARGNDRLVKTVAICAGSGGSTLLGADADVYWTGEMSHHEVLAAIASGRNVILCGHTNTERGYLPILASKLRSIPSQMTGLTPEEKSLLSHMEVYVSKEDKHPLVFT